MTGPDEPTGPDDRSPGGVPAARPAATGGGPGERDEADPPAEGAPSGLRNPAAAVRGVGAGALVIEALVLLLAIVPLHTLGVRMAGFAIGAVVGLAVACVLLAGMLRMAWAWYAGMVVQVLLLACGFFHVALAVLGVLFGGVWAYVLSVRRSVLGSRPAR